ncbi:MAG: hypothetical protein JOZ90_01420 [Alphaproteobacteria bacterium]|nr:hypothetical protein [Alphaproteobacteria bacterium]MBV9899735.1 hypothetical protein [Alphaproteobacteria bacterium]
MGRIGQSLIATLGAALLTVTAVGAAVGPARALEATPVTIAAGQVSGQAQV